MNSFLGDFAARMGVLLLAAGLPLQGSGVVFGNEGFDREVETGAYVQVLYDPAGDTYEPGTAQQPTATTIIKYQGVLVHFQAASSKPGATEDDHVAALEVLVDAFVFNTVVLCHKYAIRMRNMRSTTVLVDDVENATQQVAKLTMQMQFGRSVNMPNADQVANIKPQQQVIVVSAGSAAGDASDIVPATLYSGATATVDALTASGATLTGLDLGSSDDCSGLSLVVSGAASPGNNGTFRIQLWNSDSSVNIINPNAVSPDANDGAIVWSVVASEIDAPGVT